MSSVDTVRVLVADDDDDLLELACMQLEEAGYEVERAHDGSEALRLARDGKPDLCVFDVHMPGLQGHEVLQELRSDAETERIPVILTTATLHERSLWRLGPRPDDCLRKSREILELGDRVQAVLDRGPRPKPKTKEEQRRG
jgi:two-component system phosphate regulon response regulator PhoB